MINGVRQNMDIIILGYNCPDFNKHLCADSQLEVFKGST